MTPLRSCGLALVTALVATVGVAAAAPDDGERAALPPECEELQASMEEARFSGDDIEMTVVLCARTRPWPPGAQPAGPGVHPEIQVIR